MTLKAALYARYSTDKQRETSIEDQLRAARARAEREGWAIVARLKAAEAEKAAIEAQLASQSPAATTAAVDNVMVRYKALLLNLTDALSAETDREHTRRLLAELLGPVVVGRDDEGGAYAEMTEPAERLLVAAGGGFVDNRGCGGAILRLSTRRIRL